MFTLVATQQITKRLQITTDFLAASDYISGSFFVGSGSVFGCAPGDAVAVSIGIVLGCSSGSVAGFSGGGGAAGGGAGNARFCRAVDAKGEALSGSVTSSGSTLLRSGESAAIA